MLPFYAFTIFWAGISLFFPPPVLSQRVVTPTPTPHKEILRPTVTAAPSPLAPTPTEEAKPVVYVPPTATPTQTPVIMNVVSSGSGEQGMLDAVNRYRSSQGLAAVSEDGNTCAFANTRAGEVSGSFSHDGFQNRVNNHTLPYPSYHLVVENIAMNSNQDDVVNSWINSPTHAENLRANTQFACIGRSGDYYAYEAWQP